MKNIPNNPPLTYGAMRPYLEGANQLVVFNRINLQIGREIMKWCFGDLPSTAMTMTLGYHDTREPRWSINEWYSEGDGTTFC